MTTTTRTRVSAEEAAADPTDVYEVRVHGDAKIASLLICDADIDNPWLKINYANGGSTTGIPKHWPTFVRITEDTEPCHCGTYNHDGTVRDCPSHPAGPRPLYEIAAEIKRCWPKVYFGAVPYLDALSALDSINDNYGLDSADSIVRYFLANAQTWRGEDARRIKAELKGLLK